MPENLNSEWENAEPIVEPVVTRNQDLSSEWEAAEPVIAEAVTEPTIPTIRQAPDLPLHQRAWEAILDKFKDPEKESAAAVLALVDSENLGISPDAAYRLKSQIDRGMTTFPKANMKRTTAWGRVNKRWERGMALNEANNAYGNWLKTNDDKWLDVGDNIPIPSEEDVPVAELGIIEDAVGAAAELMPMMIQSTKEAGWKGVTLGSGFAAIAALAGQPELIPVAAQSGLTVGMTWGAMDTAMMIEGGAAVRELRQIKDKDGKPLDRTLVRGAAWGIGTLNSIFEVAGLKALVKTIPGGDKIFKEATYKTIKSKALKDRILYLAREFGAVEATEVGVELAQESTNIVMEELAKYVSESVEGTDFETDAMEIVNRLRETGVEAAKGFAVLTLPGLTVKTITATPESISSFESVLSEDTRATYEAEKARAMAKGQDEAQATESALKSVMESPEVQAHIDEIKKKAAKEGIPTTEQVLERITTEELTDEQLTEMLDIFAEGQEIIAEDVDAVSEIKNRLIDIGMPEEEASSNAALYAGFDVLAKRAGVPLDDLITRYLPEISQRDMIPEITDEDRRIVADNSVLNEVITDEAQLESFDELREIRNDLETELEANRDTWSQEQITQQEEAIDYLNTKVTEEQLIGGIPRGRIRFYSDRVNIDLLKDADQSTFVHETGHLYLMMMNDLANVETASQELKDDFQIIKDWLGVVDGEITRDQNEQFARGFEAYLREGKAPTPALKKAFENFKKWLMEIYRSLSDLDVELTDDVRGAMDRMFIDEGMEAPVRKEAVSAPGVTVRDADGVTYDQEGQIVTKTKAFKDWFGDSKVVDESGEPLVVYHGTRVKFDAFKPGIDVEGSSVGIFFTSDHDVAANYAGTADDAATSEDAGVHEVYLKIENPFIYDAKGSDWTSLGKEDVWIIRDEDGEIVQTYKYEKDAEVFFDDYNDDFVEEYGIEPKQYGEITLTKERDPDAEGITTDELFDNAIDEGYDGVIVKNVLDVGGEGAQFLTDPSDVYIVKEPTQIKSVFNRGTFDPGKPSIFEQAPVKTTFQPSKVAKDQLPETTIGLKATNHLDGTGKYYRATAQDLQSFLDRTGDGFLYRVADIRGITGTGENRVDQGNIDYKHKFKETESKVISFASNMQEAQNIIDSRREDGILDNNIVIYRILPEDIGNDFAIQIPTDRSAGPELVHVHSPVFPKINNADVIFSSQQFREGELTDEAKRVFRQRREQARREQPAGVRPDRISGPEGREVAGRAEAEAGKPVITRNKEGEVFYQSAFHGTPHKFDKFTLDHIGKGEGAQAYGWGLYFAESKGVAEWYKEKLTTSENYVDDELLDAYNPKHYLAMALDQESGVVEEASIFLEMMSKRGGSESIRNTASKALELLKSGQRPSIITKKPTGSLLRVELAPKADEWLDWDKPLSEQSEKVQKALSDNFDWLNPEDEDYDSGELGQSIYHRIASQFKTFKDASLALRDAGIPGIRYLDATSRGKERGTSNYVVFDESLIEIQEFLQAPKKPSKITNIRQLAKSLGGIDYNREHLKGELRKLIEDAPATRYIINRKNQGVPLDRLLENAIEAGILSETATLDDLLEALKTNLKTPEAIQAELEKEERAEKRIEAKAQKIEDLRKAFVDMAKKARQAYKEGKDYASVKEARKLKNILARARKIRIVRDYFNLSDADLKKISRKNPLLMSQYEFKLYIDDVRVKAVQLTEEKLAKAILIKTIHEKDLNKVDNYRRVLNLPPISKMTTNQAKTFAEALEDFHDGDTFLSERELETVDRTDLEGIKTWREARERLAKEINEPVDKLSKIKVKEWDEYKWDTALAEANPFYKMLVIETTRKLLESDMRSFQVEKETFALARKSEKSRKRTFIERIIPQDKQILEYIETPIEERDIIIEEMTAEQLDLAHYMSSYFANAREYLIKTKAFTRGRENYFVHMRRSFLENVKEEGFVEAFNDLFKTYQEDEAMFNILDDDTGNILPLEKFFQFALRRTGGLKPTSNVIKAFLTYVQIFERKKSLDELIPKMDIYAQSLTPEIYTPRGLEIDRSIKQFVNKYINNKKGRRIRWIAKQGGTIDVSIRGLRTFTTLMDLGLNIPTGVAAFVGEQVANFEMLGTKGYTKGTARIKTAKGKAILDKYEAFVGRSAWEEFRAPGKQLTERISDGLFGLFHEASVLANKQFLLGVLTEAEYNSGEISTERLAEIKIEMGRFRVVPGTKSLVGSTSAGSAMMQYKTWAAPIIRTLSKNAVTMTKDLGSKPAGEALTTREAREIYRFVALSTTAVIVGAMAASDDDDESFTGQLLKKMYRESMTLLQGVDPTLWLATPRIMGFLTQLGKNLKAIATLEEYKTKPGLKGVDGLQRQLTPRAIKQVLPEKKKTEKL